MYRFSGQAAPYLETNNDSRLRGMAFRYARGAFSGCSLWRVPLLFDHHPEIVLANQVKLREESSGLHFDAWVQFSELSERLAGWHKWDTKLRASVDARFLRTESIGGVVVVYSATVSEVSIVLCPAMTSTSLIIT